MWAAWVWFFKETGTRADWKHQSRSLILKKMLSLNSNHSNACRMTWDPTVRMSVLSVYVGGTIFKLQGSSISQPAVQRFLSLPSMKEVKKSLIIFNVGLIFLLALCVYLGLLAFAAFYDCDPITSQVVA